jgi:hypothetical protein
MLQVSLHTEEDVGPPGRLLEREIDTLLGQREGPFGDRHDGLVGAPPPGSPSRPEFDARSPTIRTRSAADDEPPSPLPRGCHPRRRTTTRSLSLPRWAAPSGHEEARQEGRSTTALNTSSMGLRTRSLPLAWMTSIRSLMPSPPQSASDRTDSHRTPSSHEVLPMEIDGKCAAGPSSLRRHSLLRLSSRSLLRRCGAIDEDDDARCGGLRVHELERGPGQAVLEQAVPASQDEWMQEHVVLVHQSLLR